MRTQNRSAPRTTLVPCLRCGGQITGGDRHEPPRMLRHKARHGSCRRGTRSRRPASPCEGLCIDYAREFARASRYSSFCRSLSDSPLESCRKKETERERQKDCRAKSRNLTEKCADPANQGVVLKTMPLTRLPFSDVVNAQLLSSTFALFGVRRFITAFISLAVIVFLEDHGDDGVVPKVRSTQKGKRQSITALQIIEGKSRTSRK